MDIKSIMLLFQKSWKSKHQNIEYLYENTYFYRQNTTYQ